MCRPVGDQWQQSWNNVKGLISIGLSFHMNNSWADTVIYFQPLFFLLQTWSIYHLFNYGTCIEIGGLKSCLVFGAFRVLILEDFTSKCVLIMLQLKCDCSGTWSMLMPLSISWLTFEQKLKSNTSPLSPCYSLPCLTVGRNSDCLD